MPLLKNEQAEAGLIVVIILFLTAIISAAGLHIAVRCFRTRKAKQREFRFDVDFKGAVLVKAKEKADIEAEAEAEECPICLSEMEEGERIVVMEKCKHGFHEECIRRWFRNSSTMQLSCPTCRCICS